jgi:hypothetical protein
MASWRGVLDAYTMMRDLLLSSDNDTKNAIMAPIRTSSVPAQVTLVVLWPCRIVAIKASITSAAGQL